MPEGRRGGPPALLEEGSGVRMPDPSPMPALEGGLVLRWQMVDGHTSRRAACSQGWHHQSCFLENLPQLLEGENGLTLKGHGYLTEFPLNEMMITSRGNPLFQPGEQGWPESLQSEQEQPGIQQGRSDGEERQHRGRETARLPNWATGESPGTSGRAREGAEGRHRLWVPA